MAHAAVVWTITYVRRTVIPLLLLENQVLINETVFD